MDKLRLSAICLIALGLAACAVTAPPERVPLAAPATWFAPLPHSGNLGDLSQWWQELGDALLVQLLQAAQSASPTIASAQSRVLQSRAARTQAAAALLPALDGSASAARGLLQPAPLAAASVQAGLQATWEIDLFGANQLASDAAQARLEGAQALWHDARVSVAAETALRYFDQRACEKQAAITQMDAASREQTARASALSAQAGFTPPAEAALARAGAADARGRVTQQRALCLLDIKALVALTDVPEPELVRRLADAPGDMAPNAGFAITSLPARVLAQRPDLFNAEREVAAASAETGSAQAQRYPRLTLAGSVGLARYRAGGFDDGFTTWSIGPLALSVPLFDAGRRAAGVDAAQARYDEAVFMYRARARQAVREVEEALVNLQSTQARVEDAAAADAGYRSWLAATQARYAAGLASLMELEETRRTALAAATTVVAVQRERIRAWIALYRAVGGGWLAS